MLNKANIAILSMILMVFGFLMSRFLLSVSMILLGASSLIGVHPKKCLKERWWLLGVLWIGAFLISYFWSEDAHSWWRRIEVKLPILLLPLAFAYIPSFTPRQIRLFTLLTGCFLLISSGYSVWYLINNESMVDQYIYSKVLPTIAQNDHIRYSLFITMYIVWSISVWKYLVKWQKVFTGIALVFLSVFLHLLAARTGLLSLYLFALLLAIYSLFNKNRAVGIVVIISIILGGVLGVKYVPTLKKKVDYVVYSYKMYKTGEHTGNYSDIGRMLSYEIALRTINNNRLTGVGGGDVMLEMNIGYNKWHSYVEEQYRLVPHNQFLIVALATGIIGLLLFILWFIYPLWESYKRKGFFYFATWAVLIPLLMVEPALEVQRGVFVFLIFLLLQRHILLKGISTEE